MPDTRSDWPPSRIRSLRRRLGWTQAEMGQAIFDAEQDSARVMYARLETGKRNPGSAVRRTLDRLRDRLPEGELAE